MGTNVKVGATQLNQTIAAEQQQQEQKSQTTVAEGSVTKSTEPSNTVTTTAPATPVVAAPAISAAPAAPTVAPAATSAPAPASAPVVDLIVTPIAVVPEAPVAVVQKTVVVEAAIPVAANAPVTEQLAVILKEVPAAYQLDIGRIQVYLERMTPKRPIDAKVGVAEQVALYRSIQNIINRQEEYFTQLFSALLFLFKAEGKAGALSDRYRMRFMDNITLHAGDRKAFANITQMLHILADPKSRELAMGQINAERALENGLTAEGRKRVLDFFNI